MCVSNRPKIIESLPFDSKFRRRWPVGGRVRGRFPAPGQLMTAGLTLEEPPDDPAVDHPPDGAVRRAVGTGDPALLDQPQDLEFLGDAGAIALVDRLLRPLAEVDVPDRAVVGGDRRDTAEDVERPAALAQQRRV